MKHCTICHKYVDDDEVKHGVRHYAHFRCYLEDGRKLHALKAWQIQKFPAKLLKEFDQLNPDLTFKSAEVERILAGTATQWPLVESRGAWRDWAKKRK